MGKEVRGVQREMLAARTELDSFRDRISRKTALLDHCRKEMDHVRADQREAEEKQRVYTEATGWLRDLYEQVQERYHGQIMQIVTYCLREVFGPEAYEFKIAFVQKRGQVEASLIFERDGEQFDPLNASGGGVLAVACFALRLAVLYLTKQSVRPIIVMDEPFAQLSVEYRERMAALLEELADQFGFQFILVTHEGAFQIGHVVAINNNHQTREYDDAETM